MTPMRVLCIMFLFLSVPLMENPSRGMQNGSKTGTLEVFVLHSKGKELPDAHVFINDTYKGKTDAEGKLIVEGLHPQRYTILVKAEEYLSKEKTVTVEQGKITVAVFEMGYTLVDTPFFETGFGIGIFVLVLIGIAIPSFFALNLFMKKKRPVRRPQKQVSLCPLCNTKIKNGWTVCPQCGAALTGTPDDKTQIY